MELQKLTDLVAPNMLINFTALIFDIDKVVNFQTNSINIICKESPQIEKIECQGFFSDLNFNTLKSENKFLTDYKQTLIIDNFNYKDIKNKIVIFIDNDNDTKFIVDTMNQTFSSETLFENSTVFIVQSLDNFEKENSTKFVFIDFADDIHIEISPKALIQEIFLKNSKKEIENITNNVLDNHLSIIANPIRVDDLMQSVYMNTLNWLMNSCLNIFTFTFKNQIDTNQPKVKELFILLNDILKNQKIVMSAYQGMNKEEIEKYKQTIFAGNDPAQYADYKIYDFIKKTDINSELIKTFFSMCSGFLKSSFCVDNGLTDKHKYYLPFYLDYSISEFILKSNFYDFEYKDNVLYFKTKKQKEYREITEIDYPIIPKELQEVNPKLSYKELEPDNFKYKVFIPFELKQNNMTFNNFMHSINELAFDISKMQVKKEYIFDADDSDTFKNFSIETFKELIKRNNPDIQDIIFDKETLFYEIYETRDLYIERQSSNTFDPPEIITSKPCRELVKSLSPIDGIMDLRPWGEFIKSVPKKPYESGVNRTIKREVKIKGFVYIRKKFSDFDFQSHSLYLLNKNFKLTRAEFNEYIDKLIENNILLKRNIDVVMECNESIVISGLFLSEWIIIDEGEHLIYAPKPNHTRLTINYLN